jgi:glycerol-3-phosphate dehydrogenase
LTILKGESWTLRQPLPGGDFPIDGADRLALDIQQEHAYLPASLIHRWVRSYGTRARSFLSNASALADLGTDFGHGLYAVEADYLVDHEWAQSAEDILWRRSKLGLRFNTEEAQKLEDYIVSRRCN